MSIYMKSHQSNMMWEVMLKQKLAYNSIQNYNIPNTAPLAPTLTTATFACCAPLQRKGRNPPPAWDDICDGMKRMSASIATAPVMRYAKITDIVPSSSSTILPNKYSMIPFCERCAQLAWQKVAVKYCHGIGELWLKYKCWLINENPSCLSRIKMMKLIISSRNTPLYSWRGGDFVCDTSARSFRFDSLLLVTLLISS